MKERDFYVVLNAIGALLDEDTKNEFYENSIYWAPEIRWYNLTEWVNTHITANSNDQISVKIYAKLCGCDEFQMIRAFKRDGV